MFAGLPYLPRGFLPFLTTAVLATACADTTAPSRQDIGTDDASHARPTDGTPSQPPVLPSAGDEVAAAVGDVGACSWSGNYCYTYVETYTGYISVVLDFNQPDSGSFLYIWVWDGSNYALSYAINRADGTLWYSTVWGWYRYGEDPNSTTFGGYGGSCYGFMCEYTSGGSVNPTGVLPNGMTIGEFFNQLARPWVAGGN